ncbi:DUF3052 domain-containing protein [Streptomyces sp. NPDC054840]
MTDITALTPAKRMGFKPGQVVLEAGWGEHCDHILTAEIEQVTGLQILNEDDKDTADVVLLWFRKEDGDLAGTIVKARTHLKDGGPIWLLVPKAGLDGYVEPSAIGDSARTAGLSQTLAMSATDDWSAIRLEAPRLRT